MKYKLFVTATGSAIIEVEANSPEEAEAKVEADFDRILKEDIDIEMHILDNEEDEG